ncbi:histidine kinase, partial [Heyndrickxia sporothermodurans]|nr:histidine kinase [Heyndrickxia sporothermodurans]
MKMKQLPIRWKITILSYAIVVFSLLVGGMFLIVNIQNTREKEIKMNAMNTARTVAELTEVKKEIKNRDGWKQINPLVEEIRLINELDYIVVMNMDHVRFSHPVKSLLGTLSKTSDEEAAFAEHNYFSKAKGEIGTFIRAFFPIKDKDYNQIGVVVVGKRLPTIIEIIADLKKEVVIIISLTLSVGLIGSFFLARNLKKQMFQLEPYEIAHILKERTATFHSMHEGIIAIDYNEIITIFNDKAKSIFSVIGDVVGKPIRSIPVRR